MGRKRGKAAKNARASSANQEDESLKKAPHSFVIHRGKVGICVLELIRDIRRLMEPFTATRLKVVKKNVLKDFISVAGPLGVSHMVVFSRSSISVNMRLIRLPRGPTLTFRVKEYTLNRDIISSLKKPHTFRQKYFHAPLIVMNNFKSDERHLKLTQIAFQNMFPSINVNTAQLSDIKRCVLLNYNSETDTIDFRHYSIKVVPTGVTRATKKLLRKQLPDMGKFNDISEYFLKPAQSSDSEFEPTAANEVELPQDLKNAGCQKSSQVAVRLIEIGPRMTLELLKIEEGVCEGEVLYHKFVKKTPEEVETIRKTKDAKIKLKEQRRKEQEENVKRKQLNVKTVRFSDQQTTPAENGVSKTSGKRKSSTTRNTKRKKFV